MVELHALGVDQHQAHLVGVRPQQQRREHRVDAARLARAGGSGDQDVRLLGEVGADRLAGDVLAEPDRQRRPAVRRLLEDVAEVDHLAHAVGHLDAHGLLAGDRREDAHLLGGERVGEVVLELGDLRHLDAGRQPQLVARHVRAGDGADHPRVHVEVAERLGELPAGALDALRVDLLGAAGALEEGRLGHPVDVVVGLGHRRAAVAHRRQLLLRGAPPRVARPRARGAPRPRARARAPSGYSSHVRLALGGSSSAGASTCVARTTGSLVVGLGRLHRLDRRAGSGRPAAARSAAASRSRVVRRTRSPVVAAASRVALDHARDRGAGEQQHPGEQQEDEQDVRAGDREELGRGPEQRLAGQPAVLAQVGGVEEAVARRVARARGRATRRRARASAPRSGRAAPVLSGCTAGSIGRITISAPAANSATGAR